MRRLIIHQGKNLMAFFSTRSLWQVFLWLILGALGVSLSVFYRTSVIYAGYNDPPALLLVPLLFEYLAFSLVAFLLPWSLKVGNRSTKRLIFSVVTTGLFFVVGYILVLSVLDWFGDSMAYDFWKGFTFTLKHSFLFTGMIYTLISLVVFYAIRTKKKKESSKPYLTRIAHRNHGETSLVDVKRIQSFESNGNYISMYTDDRERFLIRKTVQELENELDPQIFQRIHRRHIVNITKIQSYRSDGAGCLILLKNGMELKVSRTYRAHILSLLTS